MYLDSTISRLLHADVDISRVYHRNKQIWPVPATAYTVEHADPSYSGAWSVGSGERYALSGPAELTFQFTGTKFDVYGTRDAHHGIAEVDVDGVTYDVDQYAAAREAGALLWSSPPLADQPHTVRIRHTGRANASATDDVVTFGHAVVWSTDGDPYPDVVAENPAVLFEDTFDGTEVDYWDPAKNSDPAFPWFVENMTGDDTYDKVDGVLVKNDTADYRRSWTKQKFGGPGKAIRVEARVRATSIVNNTGSIEGLKFGLKFPHPSHTGYPDDPDAVRGTQDATSPGSYQFFTPCTDGGHVEVSVNGYGDVSYRFGDSMKLGYTLGEWKTIIWRVDWLDEPRVRFRAWLGDDSGTPFYDWTCAYSETAYNFWGESGFLWVRTDGTAWEMDYLRVTDPNTTTSAPTASFTSSVSDLTATFTNTSTGATSYSWDFGDGATSTTADPSHTYTDGGTYTVTLTASNSAGSTTATDTVTVTAPDTGGGGGPTPNWYAPTDSFTGSISSSWSNVSAGITVNGNNECVLPVSSSYPYMSAYFGDLTGRTDQVKVVSLPTGSPDSECVFVWRIDSSNYVGFRYSPSVDKLYFRETVNGTNDDVEMTPVDLSTVRYWRFSHDSGTDELVWETSPDGYTWTERRRKARVIDITNIYTRLHGGTWGAGSGDFIVDDVNVDVSPPPANTSLTIQNSGSNVTYTGTWAAGVDGEHYTSGTGASVTFGFTGTDFQLYGVVAPHHGTADIEVDGTVVGTMNQQADPRATDQVVFTSGTLADAEHVVTVTRTSGTITFDRAVVTGSSVTSPPPAGPGTGAELLNEQFSTARTVTGGSMSDSTWWVEDGSRDLVITNGTGKQTSATGGFSRLMSHDRYGGPGKSIEVAFRMRANRVGGGVNGSGNAQGWKMPRDPSISGWSKDDVRSVKGYGDDRNAGYFLIRHGVTVNNDVEIVRRPPGDNPNNNYYASGATTYSGKSPSQWRDVTIRTDWPVNGDKTFRFRIRVDGTLVRDYTHTIASGPNQDEYDQPAFLWWRIDDADIEWDSVVIRDVTGT